jgi:hypothetical protein
VLLCRYASSPSHDKKQGKKESLVVNLNSLSQRQVQEKTNFFKFDSRYHENALAFIIPSSIYKIDKRKGAFSGLFVVSCRDQC